MKQLIRRTDSCCSDAQKHKKRPLSDWDEERLLAVPPNLTESVAIRSAWSAITGGAG